MVKHTHNTTKQHYSRVAKLAHWGFALLFLIGIIKQVEAVDQLSEADVFRTEIIFALIFLGAITLRYLYMSRTQTSSLPEETPAFQKKAARFVHLALYLCVASIAVSGLLIGLVYYAGFEEGLLIEVVIGLHEAAITLSYGLVALHISAALYHRFKGDGVWDAMVPFWRETPKR